MRQPPTTLIRDLWNASGPFIGDAGAPHGRVTVEGGWTLQTSTATTFGSYNRGPLRWFQRSDNSQVETEVPNIKTIEIDRSVDSDAATAKITLINQKFGTSMTSGANGYSAAVLANSPFIYYRLNEVSGTTVIDSSGNGNGGSYVGSPILNQTGLTGDSDRAANFNNGDLTDNHAASNSPLTNVLTEFTIEALINFSDLRESWGYQFVAGLFEPPGSQVDIEINLSNFGPGDNELCAFVSDGSGFAQVQGPIATTGTTYHVAVVYDGTNTILYINGSEFARDTTYSGRTFDLSANSKRFFVGNDGWSSADGVAGVVDEVAFYTHALTSGDIAAHYAFVGTSGTGGTASQFEPGYFTFNRGASSQSQSRWGLVANEWADVLTPNALIRTYQGYGGKSKTIAQAVADGNLILTGTWLVDEVTINAQTGMLELSCRDMMKLAIDQEVYPPLIPLSGPDVHYPLYYFRWKEIFREPIPYSTTVYQEGFTPLESALTSPFSTSDLEGSSIAGHTKADATDGLDSETYWLSGGHVTGNTSADLEFIQWNTPSISMNGISLQPFAGNYVCYVSVMIGGTWQGTNTVPYSGSQFSGSYEPRIKYVKVLKWHWEAGEILYLDSTYAGVTKVRLTFTNLAKTSVGPKFYRCGIRRVEVGSSTRQVSGGTKKVVAIIRSSDTEDLGYWIVGNDGGVFTYGPNNKFYGSEGSARLNQGVVGAFSDDADGGYLLGASDGGAFAFGSVPYKGSLPGQSIPSTTITDIAAGDGSPFYKGYWFLQADGAVFTYGNATYHGNAPVGAIPAVAIAGRKQGGYWIVDAVGHVFAMGGAPYHGNANAPLFITDIEGTPSGNGYWIVDIGGHVYSFGDAVYHGGAPSVLNSSICSMASNHDGSGYWLVGEDGGVFACGSNARFWGSLPQAFDVSTTGNYSDYVDIVRDLLLWSGWWRYNPGLGEASPAAVYGNLESTGIYSPENLTEDFFDKKPIIDVITALKEIVGYLVWVDEIGAFHFESPNIWAIGNFYEDGTPTAYMFNIDEAAQIVDYDAQINWADARSTITIASADPLAKFPDTISTTITSQWAGDALRGIVRPALWVNGAFVDKSVQGNMASLIDLHLFMQSRQGHVTIPGNPILQINDQIRIFERTTSDTYVHYLRGYSSTMDLETGNYTMQLQTHWMGDGTSWFLTYT